MLGLIGNLSPLEVLVVATVAILIFGKRLPEVASRAVYQARRLRRALEDLRRETGIDQEIRTIERSVRRAAWEAEARLADPPNPSSPLRKAHERAAETAAEDASPPTEGEPPTAPRPSESQ